MKRQLSWWGLLAGFQLVLFCAPVPAAIFNIANGDVTGLRAAITASNSNGEDDIIQLAASGNYTLTTSGLPTIGPDGGKSLTIRGAGATIQRSTAGATPRFRIFFVDSGAHLTISSVTIYNGNLVAHGGAIYVNGEDAETFVTIESCTFVANTGDYGGAIYNDGYMDAPVFGAHLTITNSTFLNNHGIQYGGAIWSDGSFGNATLTVSGCTFFGNSAVLDTGAIQHDAFSGSATGSISNCTFVLNSAGRNGGAIYIDGEEGNASLSVSNCTLSDNDAGTHGTDLYINNGGAGTATLTVGNTVFENDGSGIDNINNAAGTIVSQGYNLSDDPAGGDGTAGPGGFLNHAGDKRNTDPLTDPAGVKDNGGPTLTLALRASSPALDQGKRSTIGISNNDQRGEAAPFDDPNIPNAAGGDGSDIGAYEAGVRVTAEDRIVDDLRVTVLTILERSYEIQSGPTPSGPWMSPGPSTLGTGGIVQITYSNAFGGSPRFFRVRQLP